MVLFMVGSAWILKSGWLHYGQNEHRELEIVEERRELGDVALAG